MAATDVILSVGMQGKFELASPYTNAIQPNAQYTIRSIRTLSSVIASGINPQDAFYTPFNVTDTLYLADLQADVCIITLQSTAGDWVHVPQSFIQTLPNLEGVSYRPLALVAPLGLVRDDKDLNNLFTAVNKTILDQLGVQSQAAAVAVGAAELVSQTEDTRITLEREARVTYSSSEAARYVKLERDNASLVQQNKILSDYIKDHI